MWKMLENPQEEYKNLSSKPLVFESEQNEKSREEELPQRMLSLQEKEHNI